MSKRTILWLVTALWILSGCEKAAPPSEVPKTMEDAQKAAMAMLNEKQESILKDLNEGNYAREITRGVRSCIITLVWKPGASIRLSVSCDGKLEYDNTKLDQKSKGSFVTQIDNVTIANGRFDDAKACTTIENPDGIVSSCSTEKQAEPSPADLINQYKWTIHM